MNTRREFAKLLGLGAAVAAVPIVGRPSTNIDTVRQIAERVAGSRADEVIVKLAESVDGFDILLVKRAWDGQVLYGAIVVPSTASRRCIEIEVEASCRHLSRMVSAWRKPVAFVRGVTYDKRGPIQVALTSSDYCEMGGNLLIGDWGLTPNVKVKKVDRRWHWVDIVSLTDNIEPGMPVWWV